MSKNTLDFTQEKFIICPSKRTAGAYLNNLLTYYNDGIIEEETLFAGLDDILWFLKGKKKPTLHHRTTGR